MDQKDKRLYGRENVELSALVFTDRDHQEVVCSVKNISEHGICFELPVTEENKSRFRKGDTIEFQFVDSFMFGSQLETDMILDKCIVRHITEKEGQLVIGCYLDDKKYEHYVVHKELSVREERK